MRTYYDVLGVAADTPDVVIKAAFRALAKEYHPDGPSVEPGDTDRFIEIQTAYAVLSKPQSRSEYDAELRETLQLPVHVQDDEPAPGNALSPMQWQPASQSAAEIERLCARLGLYSESLAQSFHEAYLRGECGDEPARFAAEMEKSFFREYFGEDNDVQTLARLLLLGSRTGAALTLNQLVAGGTSAPVKDVRSVLSLILDQHFPDEALFTEWLKVKFGLLPVEPRPAAGVGAPAPAAAARAAAVAPPPRRSREAASSSVLRSFVLVILWAVALYFTLFAALSLVE
jgi:curved DNA-binding protein CbpA